MSGRETAGLVRKDRVLEGGRFPEAWGIASESDGEGGLMACSPGVEMDGEGGLTACSPGVEMDGEGGLTACSPGMNMENTLDGSQGILGLNINKINGAEKESVQ